jgi:hypothetical protein
VPEYQASAERGPKIQSHQARATAGGDGSDALDTEPAAVTTSQAIRIAKGRAIRRAAREKLILAVGVASNRCVFEPGVPTGNGSDNEVCVISFSDGPASEQQVVCQ